MGNQTIAAPLYPRQKKTIDRRANKRQMQNATIHTFWEGTEFSKVPVIDCTADGARVIVSEDLQKNDKIGVVVQSPTGRIRTIARVAWTTRLNEVTLIVGLEFLRLDMKRAS